MVTAFINNNRYSRESCTKQWIFEKAQFNTVNDIHSPLVCVAMVTKMWDFTSFHSM